MDTTLQKYCVQSTDNIRRVLEVIQESPHHICCVLDQHNKILGTITDGDCRRALIKQSSLEISASQIMNTNFIVVDESFSAPQIENLMRANGIKQVPVVDKNNSVIEIISKHVAEEQSNKLNTPILILAGGRGRRLRPLTDDVPKPMLPIGRQPMLARLVIALTNSGFENIFISINYKGHIIENYFEDGSKWDCKIKYVREQNELGTAGPLRLLQDQVSQPLMIINGDLVTSVDFAAFQKFHTENKFDLTIGATLHSVQIPFGVLSLNEHAKVIKVLEKPTHTVPVNAGLYMLNPELIKYVPENQNYPMTDLISSVIDKGYNVGIFPLHESWFDVGLPETYSHVFDLNKD